MRFCVLHWNNNDYCLLQDVQLENHFSCLNKVNGIKALLKSHTVKARDVIYFDQGIYNSFNLNFVGMVVPEMLLK